MATSPDLRRPRPDCSVSANYSETTTAPWRLRLLRAVRPVLPVAALLAILGLSCPAAAQRASDALRDRLELALTESPQDPLLPVLLRFYEQRGFEPLWLTGDDSRAQAVLDVLSHADGDGLDAAAYGVEALRRMASAPAWDTRAGLELGLSHDVLAFATDVRRGQIDPLSLVADAVEPRDPVDPEGLLNRLAQAPDVAEQLRRLAPPSANYTRLKAALAYYRLQEARGGWTQVPDGVPLALGSRDARMPLLRARLRETEDLAGIPADPELFDEALDRAVRRFQYRHGLAQDGVAGGRTLAAMNVPIAARIDRIVLNMERRRWMRDDLGERYVLINLADANLKLVDGPRILLSTEIVKDDPAHYLPIFSDAIGAVEINPFWTVPRVLAETVLWPAAHGDPGWLAMRGYEVLSPEGAVLTPDRVQAALAQAPGALRLRQRPGPANALGVTRLIFPNRFAILLHETSQGDGPPLQGGLHADRIRRLAVQLLRLEQPGWTEPRIDRQIASGARTVVPFAKPVPIHITYITAWVDKDGSVHFRDDIHGWDRRLREALDAHRAELAPVP